MIKKNNSPWINQPKQKRSSETLERMIDSAKKLILEDTFEQASVQMIVKKANSSVGSFYNLFKDKEALLRCLLDRYEEEILEKVMELRNDNQNVRSMSDRGRLWIALLLKTLRKERGLLRTRILYNLNNPDKISAHRKKQNTIFMRSVLEFFQPSLSEVKRKDKRKALEFILMIIDYSLVYRILLEEMRDGMFADLDDRALLEEFHGLFVAYLNLIK
jgi:AcrR family transcriptional regulator